MDLADGLDEISMDRTTWGKLLSMLGLLKGSQIVAAHIY